MRREGLQEVGVVPAFAPPAPVFPLPITGPSWWSWKPAEKMSVVE